MNLSCHTFLEIAVRGSAYPVSRKYLLPEARFLLQRKYEMILVIYHL
jgi:hypothetical protein